MPDPKQLPYIIKLLDDESEIVRETIMAELNKYGGSLERVLKRNNIEVTSEQLAFIHVLRDDYRRAHVRREWDAWKSIPGDRERLEEALSLLSFLVSGEPAMSVSEHLDSLTEEYRTWYPNSDPHSLAHFMFERKKFTGAQDDFYNPENSSLSYVLSRKKGIPITLSCVYILLGQRIGLDTRGINFPGHFLASAHAEDETFIVDCFYGGRILDKQDLESLDPGMKITMADVLKLEATPEMIVERSLRNLHGAYERRKDEKNLAFVKELMAGFAPKEGPDQE